MHPFLRKYASKILSALVCATAIAAAGCHSQNNTSYYGIAWVDVTDQPGDYVSYIVTIDSVTLTRTDGVVVPVASTPELVDLTQVHNFAELWSSGSIPDGAYTAATVTLDYTNAYIAVMVNGRPQTATILDATTGRRRHDLFGERGIRSAKPAGDPADLRIDERGAAQRRFRSGGVGNGGSHEHHAGRARQALSEHGQAIAEQQADPGARPAHQLERGREHLYRLRAALL